MSLTSLAIVKQALNISPANVTRDAQLSALKDMAEEDIKNYIGTDIEPATYTEYYCGTDRRELLLRKLPVTSLLSVYQDFYGNMDWDTEYPRGSTTRISRNGILLRSNTIWQMRARSYYPLQLTPESQSSEGTIKVTYTAGWNPIPMDIQYSVAFLVAYMRRILPYGGDLEHERIGDYDYRIHFYRFPMPPEIGHIRQVLGRYKDPVF